MNHGSLQNKLYAESNGQYVPEVGMGATMIGWTDRVPYTITEVVSDTKIKVEADTVVANAWPDGNAKSITPNPHGDRHTLCLRNGLWKDEGLNNYAIGLRSYYYDHMF